MLSFVDLQGCHVAAGKTIEQGTRQLCGAATQFHDLRLGQSQQVGRDVQLVFDLSGCGGDLTDGVLPVRQ